MKEGRTVMIRFDDLGKAPVCNHRTDRGIFIGGICLPLCARCTGILLGALAGYVMLLSGLTTKSVLIGLVMILPTSIDALLEYLCGRESTNLMRLLTGMIAGVGSALL